MFYPKEKIGFVFPSAEKDFRELDFPVQVEYTNKEQKNKAEKTAFAGGLCDPFRGKENYMRSEEFIASLSEISRKNVYRFDQLRSCIPLGRDEAGNISVAHREENPERYHHVCVTGAGRRDYIGRLVMTLACLYDRAEAMFLVLSPYEGYAELLRLKAGDVTVPYIRSSADYLAALESLRGLVRMRSLNPGFPRLFVVLDGLEELPDVQNDGMLEPYKACFEAVGTSGVEIITGVNLLKSIFSGYPGAFVGIGNCLVTPKGEGKADVTYVNTDSSLTLPKEIVFPDSPAIPEAIDFFNSLS